MSIENHINIESNSIISPFSCIDIMNMKLQAVVTQVSIYQHVNHWFSVPLHGG